MGSNFVVSHNINDFLKSLGRTERQLEKAANDAAAQLGKDAAKLYAGTVRTWGDKPDFTVEVNGTATKMEVLVGTDSKIYSYVDEGTRVRRALLSPDWRSKTTPGSLRSGGGKGRVILISKKISRPGIKARGFSVAIKDQIDRKAEQTFNKLIKKAIRG